MNKKKINQEIILNETIKRQYLINYSSRVIHYMK